MKTWKKVLISVIVIVLIIAIVYGIYFINFKKKASIIRELSEKQEKTLQIDNYYQKIINTNNTAKITAEHYQKGKNSITFITIVDNDTNEIAKSIMYSNNGETKIYNETGKEDILKKLEGFAITMIPVNLNYKNSSDKNIINAIKEQDMSIESTQYNGKDCYIYTAKNIPETYFDKENGLVLKYSNSKFVSEFDFEFNNVDDKVFEPDLSGYTLVK